MRSNTRPVTLGAAAMQVRYDKPANLRTYRALIEEAAAQGVDLLVLPEQSLQGYVWGISHQITPEEYEYHFENAEPVDGPSVRTIAGWAGEFGMQVMFGMTELGRLDVLYNAAVLVGPGGDVGVFRKVHGPGDELHIFKQGGHWPVFETPVGRLGAMICYDGLFPEAARELTLGGAEILCFPTAWPLVTCHTELEEDWRAKADGVDPGLRRYDATVYMRAVENQRWLIAASQVGRDEKSGIEWCGHSRIVDPAGITLADTGPTAEGVAVASVVLSQGIRDICNTLFDFMKDRAPHTYRLTQASASWRPPDRLWLEPTAESAPLDAPVPGAAEPTVSAT